MLLKEKEDIIAWLDKYEVKNYTLREDKEHGYLVDVNTNTSIAGIGLFTIPIQFGIVRGNFWCHNNNLTSLEGAPHRVEGNFWCQKNKLISLEGASHHVEGIFRCNDNQLTSLKGLPQTVEVQFYCHNNPDLGELQDITDFKVIKSYFLSQKLANELNIKDNKNKIKL